ncbi:hypothetical protein ACFE04_030283 [Oxalis oulophora]
MTRPVQVVTQQSESGVIGYHRHLPSSCNEFELCFVAIAYYKFYKLPLKQLRVVDEQNERLRNLKNDLGDDVYKAVTNSLLEIVEYNPSGSYVTSELWNFNEDRKATLKEGIKILLNEWETAKAKNKSPICSKHQIVAVFGREVMRTEERHENSFPSWGHDGDSDGNSKRWW